MKRFIARHAESVLGVLSGFDRLVFRGTLRRIAYVDGLGKFLNWRGVLLKNFGDFAQETTARVRAASEAEAKRRGRPILYLESSRIDKEKVAREIAERDDIQEGLVVTLECVEPCITFDIHRNRTAKQLQLVSRVRKCLHVYQYWIDPTFGWMNARIQTWLPFNVQVCLNGREWLAREMDRNGLGYRRWSNCFPELEDIDQAQRLMSDQLRTDWRQALDRIALLLNPAQSVLSEEDKAPGYYWSVYQSEWATDIMFRSPEALAKVYPALVLHGITTFGSADVMRFLGRRVRSDFSGEIVSDFKDRVEGVRIKHRLDKNSLKGYDKSSILRIETTINDPTAFKVFRPKEGGPEQDRSWRSMRKGIADLHRRAQLSQASNERYLDALSTVNVSTPLGQLVKAVCQPTTWRGKRVRALRPWTEGDVSLLETVARGEFHLRGFRNRDLAALMAAPVTDPLSRRRRSARITRLIRLLRAHRLIRKLGTSHRYVLTARGHDVIPAILAAQRVTLEQLDRAAA